MISKPRKLQGIFMMKDLGRSFIHGLTVLQGMLVLFLSLAFPVAAEVPEIWCERPWCNPALFAGVDLKYSRMVGREFWKHQFPTEYLSPNIYIGTQFHQYFGISVGYEQSAAARVHVVYTPADNFFFNPVDNLRFSRTMVVELIHANLEYYLPLSFCQDLEGLVSIGGGFLRIRTDTKNISGTNTELQTALTQVKFNRPGISRACLGFQYRLMPVLFLRAFIGFENTGRAHIGGSNPRVFLTHNVFTRPLSDMFSGYLGLMFKFGI